MFLLTSIASVPASAQGEDKLKPIWFETWGGKKSEGDVRGITVDEKNGDIYLVGYTHRFGGQDVFLLKYNARDGNLEKWKTWSADEHYGKSSYSNPHSVVFYDDHVYVAGATGCGSGSEAFLLKYDSDSELKDSIVFEKRSKAFAVVAYNDYIYVTGHNWNNADINPDVALWCFDLDFNKLWCKTWDGSAGGDDYGTTLVEYQGYLYISGTTQLIGSHGCLTHDVVLLKYDANNPDSELIFIDSWGTNDWDEAKGIVAYQNHLYITGLTQNYGNVYDIFLLKYDTLDSGWDWCKIWEETNYDENVGYGIAIGDNHIFVAGYVCKYSPSQIVLAVVLKYDLDGNLKWSKTWHPDVISQSAAGGRILAYDNCLYVGGHCTVIGKSTDAFLLKCNYNGGGGKSKSAHPALFNTIIMKFLENHPLIYQILQRFFLNLLAFQ